MTALDPVASRSPTGHVWLRGPGRASLRNMVAEPGFDRQIGPMKRRDRHLPHPIRAGLVIERRSCYHRRQPGGVISEISAENYELSSFYLYKF